MTNEERDLIAQFVGRVGGAAAGFSRSVPTTQPSLPPVDPEADRYIAEQFQQHPEARYRITQMAVVQEAALAEAANRIQRLQAELQQMQQQQAQPAPQKQGGLFSGLFGGAAAAPQAPQGGAGVWNQGRGAPPQYAQQQQYAPPPPQYPPNMQPGMFQQSSGSGFLGGALKTAAGVAGGVVAGNLLMDMFSGHGGGMGGFGGGMGGGFGGGMPTETTVINNYGDAGGANDPAANWDNQTGGGSSDGGGWDNSQGGGDAGWSDNSGGGGGFDNGGGGGGFDDSNSL